MNRNRMSARLSIFAYAAIAAATVSPLARAQQPAALDRHDVSATKKPGEVIEFKVALDPHQGELASKHAKLGVACSQCHSDRLSDRVAWTFGFTTEADSPLGVTTIEVDETAKAQLGLARKKGLLVNQVREKSVGAELGIHVGDVLVSLGSKDLNKPDDLKAAVAAQEDSATLYYVREGKDRTLSISMETLAKLNPNRYVKTVAGQAVTSPAYWIGVGSGTLEPALRKALKIKDGQGIVATTVVDDSPAAKSGVKTHDILLSIDGKAIENNDSLVTLVQKYGEKSVELGLVREGKPLSLKIKPEKRPARWGLTATTPAVDPKVLDAIPAEVLYRSVQPGVVLSDTLTNQPARERVRSYTLPNNGTARLNDLREQQLNTSLDRLSKQLDELGKQLEDLKKERKSSEEKPKR